jgi:Carboxypeptidase regulatory-like domain/WD domain, G-beta repeat
MTIDSLTIVSFDTPHRMATHSFRGGLTLLLAASLLAIGRSVGAQQPPDVFRVADSTGESDVYPVGDAIQVYREILDLLYVDGGNRPSVIVLWDRAVPPLGWPCNWKCREMLPHQSTIDSSMILAFTRQSLKTPRIIDFGYKIPIARVTEADYERLQQLGFGYLAHLPPENVGPVEAFWEGFKRKYPGAWGRLVLGKVGFNPQHTEALIRVHQSCGPECRSDETVFLERAGREWRVIERLPEPYRTTQSSGGLRYRGPRVPSGQTSEIVAKSAPDARPRVQSDDAVKIPLYSGVYTSSSGPKVPSDQTSEIVAKRAPDAKPRVQSDDAIKIGVYSGVYTSTGRENIFSPCDVPGIGSGWAVRFKNPRHGAFLQYQFRWPSGPSASHFIRVRGRVSAPGRFGIGFQAREIVVDSVLDISESPQPCLSYEDPTQPWSAIAPSGSRTVGGAVSEDRTLAAALDAEAIIRISDVARSVLVRQFPALDSGRLDPFTGMTMEFTRDGKLLAAGGPDGVVRVWNVSDGRRIWSLAGNETMRRGAASTPKEFAPSAGLSFNESGTFLANTILDKTVIWSMTTGERLWTHQGDRDAKFLFLGDSSFIASGGNGLVSIYPRPGAAPIRSVRIPAQSLVAIQRSRDGHRIILKSDGDTAYLWSPTDSLPGRGIPIPEYRGEAIAFSPDGNTVAIAGGTNGLYLWETATGSPLRSFHFPSAVQKAWFTADGRSIIALSSGRFLIVHLGDEGRSPEPVQARWEGYLLPANAPPHSRSISGFVRDANGQGIVKADISLYDGDRPGSARIARVSTNAAGYYLVQNVAPAHVIVQAETRGFDREIKYVHLPTYSLPVDLKMRKTGR